MVKLGIYLSGSPQCGGTYSYNKTILDSLICFIKKTPNCELVVYYLDRYWEDYLLENQVNKVLVKNDIFSRIISCASRILKVPVYVTRRINKYFSSLHRKMRAENCTLWFFPSQDSISFLFPLSSVVAIHDLMHRYEPHFPEIGNKKEYAIREYAYSNMTKWCKAIFVDSNVGKKHVQESYAAKSHKILVLPFISGQLFSQNYSTPKNFDEKYQLTEKYLFYPAQFWLHKNHLNLLEAFKLIKDEFPELHLVFVGAQKNSLDLVNKKIQELQLTEKVNHFGFVDECDIPEFYRRAFALIMPTYCGPTNIPPLEAFKMSCPVLASRVYGVPEQLGEAAIYFDPNNPQDIADNIKLILTNPELRIKKIALGFERVNSWNENKFYELFQEHVLSLCKNKF